MEDQRAWSLEESLWTGEPSLIPAVIDRECLMVIPTPPHILSADVAVGAMTDAPRFSQVRFGNAQISRPEKGLIVLAYTAHARRAGDEPYVAHCTSTWRRLRHQDWRLVQHQQTPGISG